MKNTFFKLIIGLVLLASLQTALAQKPIITSFSGNGVLVCSNLYPGSAASIEWASSLNGPWFTDWSSLTGTPVASNGTITVAVPMFYRVRGFNTNNFAADGTVLIPAGSFMMGDTLDGLSDAVPINIYLSGYYMATNLVTLSQWQPVYDWATNHGYFFSNPGSGSGPNYPVEALSWYDCLAWCNALSQKEGLAPCYYADAGFTQVYTNATAQGFIQPHLNLGYKGYRLPTEAEWEKAARGQIIGARFPWGNTISGAQANYLGDTNDYAYDLGPNGNPWGGTSPVGYFPPNGYGLYDMAGNVWQYCWDTYGSPYGQPTTNNPTGATAGSFYFIVRRGGRNNSDASFARTGARSYVNGGFRSGSLRLVRTQ